MCGIHHLNAGALMLFIPKQPKLEHQCNHHTNTHVTLEQHFLEQG
jgi:hypothetical protein